MSGENQTRSGATGSTAQKTPGPIVFQPTDNKKADVKFTFPKNDGKIIMAEKHILMERSEVFRKQFQASVTQKDLRLTEIIINDISIMAFIQVIYHLYGYKETINQENFLELLYASRKYCVNLLTFKVIEFIRTFITEKNIMKYFESIEKHNVKILNDHMQEIFVAFPLEFIEQLAITTAQHKRILKIILESPYLPCTEFLLYRAIWRALKKEFQRLRKPLIENAFRKELGSLIHLIRFPTMTIKELLDCGTKPSLLTTQQLTDIQLWLESKNFTDTMQNFSAIPRFAKVAREPTNNSSNTSPPITSNQATIASTIASTIAPIAPIFAQPGARMARTVMYINGPLTINNFF